MNYNTQYIQKLYNTGNTIKFLFFWGHQASKDGTITKSCFSQWWELPFVVAGICYNTAEHWMMAEKARLFKDEKIEQQILDVSHPHDAKKLGRKVKNFEPKLWNEHKYEIVKKGNYYKFSQDKDLKQFLIQTKNRVIVEASPRDRIWGIGMSQNNENANNPNLWRGQNLLGFALMEVRDSILEENEN